MNRQVFVVITFPVLSNLRGFSQGFGACVGVRPLAEGERSTLAPFPHAPSDGGDSGTILKFLDDEALVDCGSGHGPDQLDQEFNRLCVSLWPGGF